MADSTDTKRSLKATTASFNKVGGMVADISLPSLHLYGHGNATLSHRGASSMRMGFDLNPRLAPLQSIALPDSTGRSRVNAPLLKLSVHLVDTYVEINRQFYIQQKKRRAARQALDDCQSKRTRQLNDGYDDRENNYIVRASELWDNRYRVNKLLGKGSFGQVVEAYDTIDKELVAIKIIKNRRAFHQQGLVEIRTLDLINGKDAQDRQHIVRFKRHFQHRNHLCLAFELLSFNLYELLRNNSFRGLSLELVRVFAIQILHALKFLSGPDVSIIHCDLKPENVLLCDPRKDMIKLIDFGSSCLSDQRLYTYIQSRFYRSPEVILGMPYDVRIDMWSLGCMLVELYTGHPLFSGCNEHEQLCRMCDKLGNIPIEVIYRGSEEKVKRFYRKTAEGDLFLNNSKHFKADSKTLTETIRSCVTFPQDDMDCRNFLDLVERMLVYDPAKRMDPYEALRHPFCRMTVATNTPIRRSARLNPM